MCFCKTFGVFHVIEKTLKETLSFADYGRGCHVISESANIILQQLGYNSKVQVVAMWVPFRQEFIPHFLCVLDDFVVDFKQRVFGQNICGTLVEYRDPICGRLFDQGWVPYYQDGTIVRPRQYQLNPTVKTFKNPVQRRKYLEFLKFDVRTSLDAGLFHNAVQALQNVF